MRQITCVAAIAAALFLSACGGGGSGGGGPITPPDGLAFPRPEGQPYQVSGLPTPRVSDAQHMPIYHDGRHLAVGVDQSQRHLGRLPMVGSRDGFTIRHGRAGDGVGPSVVAEYLTSGTPGELTRFLTRPTVRLVGDNMRPQDIERIHRAVQLVNAALPEWAKMQVSASRPETHAGFAHTISSDGRYYGFRSGAQSGVIYIEVITRAEYNGGYSSVGTGWSYERGWPNHDGTIDHSYIQLVEDYARTGEGFAERLVAHEIVHALGVDFHVSRSMASIMDSGVTVDSSQPLSILYPADREALRAIYSGTSSHDYGPWSSTSVHIAGNGAHSAFGVRTANGYAEPWAYGYLPDTNLANNYALSGSATWTGTLLGFTPSAAPVAGDARIGVTLATLTGRADFTSLETWTVGAAPGAAGTGTTWLDGDLGYTIAVTGNTFRETGGDDGRLTGIFTGAAHEGAAGTLERTDLTAAFGASR